MHGRNAARRAPTLIRGDRTQQRNCWFLPRAFAPTAARLELVSSFLETAQSGISRRTLRRNLGILPSHLPVWQGTARHFLLGLIEPTGALDEPRRRCLGILQ
jgi:hypothetical protein